LEAYETVCSDKNREEWLLARRSGIGASDSPAVLGASKFASALMVYANKLGLSEDVIENEAMSWGRRLEPIVAEQAAIEIGARVGMHGFLLRSLDYPFLICTLDAMLEFPDGSRLPMEVKCTNRIFNWEAGEIPDDFRIQVQHQLAVTGFSAAYLAVLVSGNKLLWTRIERDDTFIALMIQELSEFWKRVQSKIPPAMDGSESARRVLESMFPRPDGRTVALPGYVMDLDSERELIRANQAVNERRMNEIDNQIKLEIGDAEIGLLPDGTRFRWSLVSRKEYIVPASEYRRLSRSTPGKGRL
jgi:putative phage-type endonuclease